MSIYGGLKKTSVDLIKKYGAGVTLQRTTKTNVDPVEGTSDTTITNYPAYAVLSNQEAARRGGRIISAGEKLASVVVDEPPQVADVLLINGERWNISLVDTVSPGGIELLYKCQVSKA